MASISQLQNTRVAVCAVTSTPAAGLGRSWLQIDNAINVQVATDADRLVVVAWAVQGDEPGDIVARVNALKAALDNPDVGINQSWERSALLMPGDTLVMRTTPDLPIIAVVPALYSNGAEFRMRAYYVGPTPL